MLKELLARYGDPSFRAQLKQLHRSPATMLEAMGPLLLRTQAPSLIKYGLPASSAGVELMKFAVHRRIAEGASQLTPLANEARRVLGLAPIPDLRGQSAEAVLAKERSDGGRRGATVAMQLNDLNPEAAADLISSIAMGRQMRAMSSTTADLIEGYLHTKPQLSMSVGLCLLHMARAGLPGDTLRHVISHHLHTDPHRTLVAVPVLAALPSANKFFREYVLPSRPAILRGLVDASRFPPLGHFPDFTFLRERCGHRRVPVKSLALDDKEGRPVFATDPEMRMTMNDFLDAVEESEATGSRCPFYLGKVALRAELPELDEVLRAAKSGSPVHAVASTCFGKLHKDGTYAYFGCDRNVTPTHFDGFENMLVCLCGTKRLWLFPPSDARHLYCAGGTRREPSRAAAPPFQTFENLSGEMRAAFPEVKHARPLEVNLGPGDFLYLPATWWHCVEGSRERNMILNWWFEVHPAKRGHEGEIPGVAPQIPLVR